MTVPGYVLAGGLSSRMGEDKAGLALAGEPLVARVVARLARQTGFVVVNSNEAFLPGLPPGTPLLPDVVAGRPGPLAGVLTALLDARARGMAHAVTVPVDAPFFPADLVRRLTDAARGRIAVAACGGMLHPVFALWPVTLAEPLARFIATDDTRRVRHFIAINDGATVDFPATGAFDPFFNINTPENHRTAEAWIAGRTGGDENGEA
ncbi:molybdenum cofactor guanylyltransferase MobA [Ensifer soli]|uniref:molybdenum cofactor guanylyltransferase MobA n=1 Tax=Ciceribacter sp. sgz301302 TaxID=3342379 RepID=UPI0035B7165D